MLNQDLIKKLGILGISFGLVASPLVIATRLIRRPRGALRQRRVAQRRRAAARQQLPGSRQHPALLSKGPPSRRIPMPQAMARRALAVMAMSVVNLHPVSNTNRAEDRVAPEP